MRKMLLIIRSYRVRQAHSRRLEAVFYENLTINVSYRWIVKQGFGVLTWLRGIKIYLAKILKYDEAFLEIACTLRFFK